MVGSQNYVRISHHRNQCDDLAYCIKYDQHVLPPQKHKGVG